jgi:dephospho-CoA kinase
MSENEKKIVGLTGGIGSGKSTVSSLLRKKGIEVIDMDQIGKEIYSLHPDLPKKLEEALGVPLKNARGGFEKYMLRDAIFSDTEKKQRAEEILHPLIRAEFEKRAAAAKSKIVVCEAALHIEAGYDKWLKDLIVVIAPEKDRIERVMKRDAISEDLVQQILKTQVTDEERKKKATHIIQNEGDRGSLERQVELLVHKL